MLSDLKIAQQAALKHIFEIADQMGSDPIELARLLALVNVAMADAAISTAIPSGLWATSKIQRPRTSKRPGTYASAKLGGIQGPKGPNGGGRALSVPSATQALVH